MMLLCVNMMLSFELDVFLCLWAVNAICMPYVDEILK